MKKLYLYVRLLLVFFFTALFGNVNAQFPFVSVSSPTVGEGSQAVFVITLSNVWTSAVNISLSATTGTAGIADFASYQNTITIPAGATSTNVFIQTTVDNIYESDENFYLSATPLNGSTSPPVSTGTCTILNTTQKPTVVVSNPFGFEGSNAIFEISLSRPSAVPTIINISTTTGTATTIDFTNISTAVIINPEVMGVAISVPITSDANADEGEKFTLTATITSSNTTNSVASGTCTIVEPNVLRTLVASETSFIATEGSPIIFKFKLNYPSNVDTVINFQTQNGTAGNNDFTAMNQQKILFAGDLSVTVSIPTIADGISEGNENFQLNATVVSSNTTNTTTTATTVTSATGIIIDATPLPLFLIANANTTEGSPAVFVTNLSAPSNVPTFINVQTTNGTALNPSDYLSVVTTIIIPAGATTFSVPVQTIADNISESTETFTLTANVISTNTANITAQGTGTIIDVSTLKVNIVSTYNDFNNDGLMNVGDVIYCQFSVTNLTPFTATNTIINNNPAPVSGATITTLLANSTSILAYYRVYNITQSDINTGVANISAQAIGTLNGNIATGNGQVSVPLIITKGFKLNAFIDNNSNGFQDGTEPNFNQGIFSYQVNNGVIRNLYSSSGFVFVYENNANNFYNFSFINTNAAWGCYGQYTILVASYSNVTVGASGIATYNFALTPEVCNDLSVHLTNDDFAPRPGFEYKNFVIIRNNGNQTIASGAVTFTKNNVASLVSTSLPTTTTTNGFMHTFTNLLPNEQRNILVRMQVPIFPTAFSGQILTNSVVITTAVNDVNTSNNQSAINQTVVNSWDPNDKVEMRGPKIVHSTFTTNDFLTYKIQFENTGTASAINIRITDALSNKLNENTLQMIDASHPFVLDRTGFNLVWNFAGINLPPSVANTQIGHGYVVFQIKPKTPFAIGDIIPNSANIYFDFNPAIVTNTWTTEFVATLDQPSFIVEKLKIYPNPTSGILAIESQYIIEQISFSNIQGQTVLIKTYNQMQTQTDISSFATGVYFAKIKIGQHSQTIKILKK